MEQPEAIQEIERSEYAWLAGHLTDAELIANYQRSGGAPGDAQTDAFAAEMRRRNLALPT